MSHFLIDFKTAFHNLYKSLFLKNIKSMNHIIFYQFKKTFFMPFLIQSKFLYELFLKCLAFKKYLNNSKITYTKLSSFLEPVSLCIVVCRKNYESIILDFLFYIVFSYCSTPCVNSNTCIFNSLQNF